MKPLKPLIETSYKCVLYVRSYQCVKCKRDYLYPGYGGLPSNNKKNEARCNDCIMDGGWQ